VRDAAIGVIPSRYGSTRLPAKPLALIRGKPLVRWVWERARAARALDRVVVATDDRRIADVVESFGGEAVMTPADCPSGTDRVLAAVRALGAPPGDDAIVANVQGDEPAIDPAAIDACVEAVRAGADVATPSAPLRPEDQANPNVVKVVADADGFAVRFSRPPLPGGRKHLGLYVFRRAALERIVAAPPTEEEKRERLEQLRFMALGLKIRVVEVARDSVAVDTAEDIARAEALV